MKKGDKPQMPEKKKKLKIIPQFKEPVNVAGKIPIDVLGSYTGTPLDGEIPVQDADDL